MGKGFLNSQNTGAGDAILTGIYDEEHVFRGNCFFFLRDFTVPNASELNLIFKYSDYLPLDEEHSGEIAIKAAEIEATNTPISVKFYISPTYNADGTEFHATNANNNYTEKTISGTTLIYGATITDNGTAVDNLSYTIGGDAPGVTGGGGKKTGIPLLLLSNESLTGMMKITNNSGTSAVISILQVLYEL